MVAAEDRGGAVGGIRFIGYEVNFTEESAWVRLASWGSWDALAGIRLLMVLEFADHIDGRIGPVCVFLSGVQACRKLFGGYISQRVVGVQWPATRDFNGDHTLKYYNLDITITITRWCYVIFALQALP